MNITDTMYVAIVKTIELIVENDTPDAASLNQALRILRKAKAQADEELVVPLGCNNGGTT